MTKVCLIYDCLFPFTVGGAERWYRNLGEHLVANGFAVTYLTLRQWEAAAPPDIAGIDVVSVGPRLRLYDNERRRILPPLIFGWGVLRYLIRHRGEHQVVHTASFPFFSLIAAGLVKPFSGYRLVVDWHEVWTLTYWRGYVGRIAGSIGWLVQRLCITLPHTANTFSRLHADRLSNQGYRGTVHVLTGEYATPPEATNPQSADPLVVFAGRHIPEKRVTAMVPAMALARESLPDLRGIVFGDGPDRGALLKQIDAAGMGDIITAPGFVESQAVDDALRRALCLVLPSRREGYGLVVIEAAAKGTPSILVRGSDNAATELIEHGVNGFIAESASPQDLAAAILAVATAGPSLRLSTARWFAANAERLSLSNSFKTVVMEYG